MAEGWGKSAPGSGRSGRQAAETTERSEGNPTLSAKGDPSLSA